nr:hypothetical protein K-LCC10_0201 [Kaumoebavirus]
MSYAGLLNNHFRNNEDLMVAVDDGLNITVRDTGGDPKKPIIICTMRVDETLIVKIISAAPYYGDFQKTVHWADIPRFINRIYYHPDGPYCARAVAMFGNLN